MRRSKGRRGGERDARARPKEMCLCGHNASKHTALRYTCQAPGDRRGFCPCMRFIAKNSAIGKRTRELHPADAATESTSQ